MRVRLAGVAGRFRLWGRDRQTLLPFQKRTRRLDRVFRGSIVLMTVIVLTAIWAAWPTGRSAALGLAQRAKWGAMRWVGLEPERSEIDAYWRDRRDRREVTTRARYGTKFATLAPEMQAFFRAAGMAPDQAEFRWANYDMTLVLSSQVFARVDSGRQYQLRPGVRSVWYRLVAGLDVDRSVLQFPDTPEVQRFAGPAGAKVFPELFQTTNSWGCRGPEPDMNAPLRGVVLGDSFMQGYLVGDDETPPERLRQSLMGEIGADVAILNTGTLGYCPEHYYYTLCEFADRFRPRFVVVGLYSNDFGEDVDVMHGDGDWLEQKHWLELILRHCRGRGIICLFAPVPCEGQLAGPRNQGHYPGQVSNITGISGRLFCDAADAFIDEDLKVRTQENSRGATPSGRSHLYNGRLGDGHLSPEGAALWGKVVARRLALLIGQAPTTAEETAVEAKSTQR
jgi:hypothetical protein